MRAALVGSVIGIAFGVAVSIGSCTTDRPSEAFKCSSQADCGAGRVCTQGYCVVGTLPADARPADAAVCPAICQDQCDFQTTTCTIQGTGGGNITCPAGWNCNITCPVAGACGTITCTNADSCNIDCPTPDACLGITCGNADCNVDCAGANACGNISCSSGDCTATCTGADACGNISCSSGDCTATCSGTGACGTLTCSSGRCRETCSGGSAACGTVNCGSERCEVTCQGSAGAASACGTVNCTSSCQCDVTCDGTTNLCPGTMNCPDAPGPDVCTTTGSAGAPCFSGFAPQCAGC